MQTAPPKPGQTFNIPKFKPPGTSELDKAVRRAGDAAKSMKEGFKNGKMRGETTHIKELNYHFTWKPGFLYCITGYPGGGKTEMTQYLALLKAKFDGKKWACHSPENYPEDEFFDSLAQTLIGKPADPFYGSGQMSMQEYEQAIDFLHEHFFYVYQEGKAHTPEFLREVYAHIHAKHGLYGTITDPWNKLAHSPGSLRDDQYLQSQLPLEQQQARELNMIKILCVHPKSPGRVEPGEPMPIPNQYSLAGGAMWDNMCDVIAAVYRPNYHVDKKDTTAQFISHKVKKQSLVGIPGTVEFDYRRKDYRYYQNGICPLVPHETAPEPEPIYNPNKFNEAITVPF